ncbi:YebC/PmpR family DNA-binding transcriptional regulator [Paenibacillus mucilaginosus]|uniref:YebC/PmpR family DNA-binding transcriptional regulator n=1 Tax=Paenibacillus mucilaginosus TaxID=61624 RepID=UPI003D1932FA
MIDRALEKAQGGSEEIYEEIRFEGFGADGTKVIVEALTRNVNRTASEVRDAFEEANELLSESPVRDYYLINEEDVEIILCPLEEFHVLQEVLQNAGVAEFTMVEQTMEARAGLSGSPSREIWE